MSEVEKPRDLKRELTNVARKRDNAVMKIKPPESEIIKLRESGNAWEDIHKALADTMN